jgi:hypothetical protein
MAPNRLSIPFFTPWQARLAATWSIFSPLFSLEVFSQRLIFVNPLIRFHSFF